MNVGRYTPMPAIVNPTSIHSFQACFLESVLHDPLNILIGIHQPLLHQRFAVLR